MQAADIIAALSLAVGAPLEGQQVPRKAGEWTIQVLNGKPIPLAAHKGKPVLLAFILTTCPHCQHAVELLNKLQPEYAPRGLDILASAIDQDGRRRCPGSSVPCTGCFRSALTIPLPR